jgi:hypothetical protein
VARFEFEYGNVLVLQCIWILHQASNDNHSTCEILTLSHSLGQFILYCADYISSLIQHSNFEQQNLTQFPDRNWSRILQTIVPRGHAERRSCIPLPPHDPSLQTLQVLLPLLLEGTLMLGGWYCIIYHAQTNIPQYIALLILHARCIK